MTDTRKDSPVGLAIHTRDLTKRFPEPGRLGGVPLPFSRQEGVLAVDGVDLDVELGQVFGLVGPNGAGKTTLVKMLSTLILPTSGTAWVNGLPLTSENERRIKASIGLVTNNERSFYPRLSCRENLRFYAGLYDLSAGETDRRIGELSDILNLDPFLGKRYDTCSTGMKHRLGLARGLINSPELLFLDEPTRSLDPVAAARFRQALYALAHREGRTIFLVTHDLEEASGLCDRVGVMVEGQLRVVDDVAEVRESLQPAELCSLQIRGATRVLYEAVQCLRGVDDVQLGPRRGDISTVQLRLRERDRALPLLLRTIAETGGVLEDLDLAGGSWEEVFANLDCSAARTEREAGGAELGATATKPRATPVTEPDHTTVGRASPGAAGRRTPMRPDPLRALGRAVGKPLLFFHRDLRTQMRYRLSFVLQVLGILFSSASFYFVAQLLGANAAPLLDQYGGDYFSFVLIGIAFVGYQGVALYSFAGVIQRGQREGTLEAMLATPTRLSTILFSSGLWNFAFTSLRVIVYLLLGVLLLGVDLGKANLLSGLVILLLTILSLSGIGILSACFIMVFKRGSPINFVIGSLSSLVAGVYYPVAVLPTWLQTVARFVPLTYSLEGVRRALLKGEGLGQLASTIAALSGFSVVLLPLSLVAFRYAVRQAKRDGSLAHF